VVRVPEGILAPERFVVCRWADPVVEQCGFPVNSAYTETVLLPILGPSTTFCLRRLGSLAVANPKGVEVDTRQLARDLGLGEALSRHSPMNRTLGRLCQFDMAKWAGGTLAVRAVVAPVPERQLRRLSSELVAVHEWMVRRQATQERTAAATAAATAVSPAVEGSAGMGMGL
jgi:hypothetical protein